MVWGGWGIRSILGAGRGKGDKARMAGSWAVPWAAGGREVGKGRAEGLDEMCVCRLAVAHWAEGGGSRETGPACPGENADGPGKMGGTERRDPGEAGGSKGGGRAGLWKEQPFLDAPQDTQERIYWLLAAWACSQEPALGISSK